MIIDKYLIDVDTLDILPKGQDKIIYFRWCKCPDCILFENEILKKYSIVNAKRNALFHGGNVDIQIEDVENAFNAYMWLKEKLLRSDIPSVYLSRRC